MVRTVPIIPLVHRWAFNFIVVLSFSLTKDESKRPKYRELLVRVFFLIDIHIAKHSNFVDLHNSENVRIFASMALRFSQRTIVIFECCVRIVSGAGIPQGSINSSIMFIRLTGLHHSSPDVTLAT